MKTLAVVGLVIIFLSAWLVERVITALPPVELRRRSRSANKSQTSAKRLVLFGSFGRASRLFLWLIGTASATVLLIWATKTSYWLGALTAVIISDLLVNLNQHRQPPEWLINLSGLVAGAYAWLLHWLEPILSRLPKSSEPSRPTGLFEIDDLVELLSRQAKQPSNRIAESDLKTAAAALSFSDQKVESVMEPIKNVRIVLPSEAIGPHLMDELHASGHNSFPVGKKTGKHLPPDLEGTVYLRDLVANPGKVTAGQVVSEDIFYISAERQLSQALETFLTTHASILIVKDEDDQVVGVIWLDGVLAKLLGRQIVGDDDNPLDADERQKVIE